MAANTKIENQASCLMSSLTQQLSSGSLILPVIKLYDANSDLYLRCLSAAGVTGARIKFEQQSAPASGAVNMFGQAQRVYTPHVIKIGFEAGTQASGTATIASAVGATHASGTATLNAVVGADYASGTVTCGVVVGGDFATGTITCEAGLVAGDTVTVNADTYTVIAVGPPAAKEFVTGGADTALSATNLAAAITLEEGGVPTVTAVANGSDVVVTATARGVAGNAFVFVEVGGHVTLVPATGTLAGGVDGDTVTVNTNTYTAIASGVPAALEFVSGGADTSLSATNLTAAITLAELALPTVAAVANANVVEITAVTRGVAGNAFVFTETGASMVLAPLAGTLDGGVDGSALVVDGVTFLAAASNPVGDEFLAGADVDAAIALAAAINTSTTPGVSGVYSATALNGVVTVVADALGVAGNAITFTDVGAEIVLNPLTGVLAGGVAGDTMSINGVSFMAVADAADASGSLWWIGADDSASATNLAAAITGSVSPLVAGVVTASADLAVVTVKAVASGPAGNTITFTETGATITLAPLTGFLAGGAGNGASEAFKTRILAECARIGMTMKIYNVNDIDTTLPALDDDSYLVVEIRDLYYGMTASV